MSSDRRATADDEREDRTASLSNFLMDTLRPPRPQVAEPPPTEPAIPETTEAELAALEEPGAEEPPQSAEDPTAAAGAATQPDTEAEAQADADVDAPDADAFKAAAASLAQAALASEAFEDEAGELEAGALPPALPIGEPGASPDIDEPDPSLVFLAQERRARRTQRIAVAAVVVVLLLFSVGFLWLKRGTPEPVAEAAEPPVAAPAPPVAAKRAEPAAPANDQSPEPEATDEGTPPVMKSGLSAAFKAPAADPSAAAVPGGVSTARYPDLPRDVLIQLENAAGTAEKQP
jgi:hypothetical protein